jgi:hypothetical protein
MTIDAEKGVFVLIKHPNFDSFAVIHVYGDCPTNFPRQLPRNQDGGLDGVEITANHRYLDYLKREWSEGLNDFDRSEKQEVEEMKYQLAVQYMMM